MNLLTCPICHAQLTQTQTMLKCAHNHSFDIAKEGYVNLLRKAQLGDTREMLQARRTFLERGFYQPLSSAINELVATYRPAQQAQYHILDAGCGEGYYLGRLQEALGQQHLYMGIDISKDGVRMAAKRYHEASFVVANLKEPLALADKSIHILLNIFAPRNPDEFARVVAPGGLLIVVIPNNEHLQPLRTMLHLLAIEESKQAHVIEQFSAHFTLSHIQQVCYTLQLARDEIALAVRMTPNYWHMSETTREAMTQLAEVETTVSFTCLAFLREL
jgi:ubiquinone/menaquinone biosynthesis C-methylase UbiE